MSFKSFKKGVLKSFMFFFVIISCFSLIGRAQAGTSEARDYFADAMHEMVFNPTGYFQCLNAFPVPSGYIGLSPAILLIQDLKNGFETILSEFERGVPFNQISMDWSNQVLTILGQSPMYSCIQNFASVRELNRIGNALILALSLNSGFRPFQVSQSNLEFGSVLISSNAVRSPQRVTITNVSGGTMSFNYYGLALIGFDVDLQQSTCNQQTSLSSGQSCSIAVLFNPSQPGVYVSDLTVGFSDNNAYTYIVNVPLYGTGIASTK